VPVVKTRRESTVNWKLVLNSLLPALLLTINGKPIIAQEAPIRLPNIDVTAARPAPEGKRRDLSYPSTGIDREVIEQIPDSRLGGALQRLPGVTMGGAPGERKDVRLRGLDKEFTRTQFGGVQLTDGGEKREFQVFRFPSVFAGEVEIIRNPTAEFEGDGIAGRVNVEFRDIPDERRIDIETGIGSGTGLDFGDRHRTQIAYGERFGNFGAQIVISRVSDPLNKDKRKEEIGKKIETEDELKDEDFTDVFADFAWFGSTQTLHVKPLLLNLDSDKSKTKSFFKADGTPDGVEDEAEDERRRTYGLIAEHNLRLPGSGSVESIFAYSKTTEDKDKQKAKFKPDGSLDKTEDEDEEKKDESFEVKAAFTQPFTVFRPHQLKTCFQLRYRDRFRDKVKIETKGGVASDKTGPKDNYQIEEQFAAAFVQDEITLAPGLSFTPGLRIEHMDRETASGDGTKGSATFTDVLPSAHLRWLATEFTAFHASISRQVNRPKFDELSPFENETGDRVFAATRTSSRRARHLSILAAISPRIRSFSVPTCSTATSRT